MSRDQIIILILIISIVLSFCAGMLFDQEIMKQQEIEVKRKHQGTDEILWRY